MNFQTKLTLVGIIGLCIIFIVCIAGCGGISLVGLDDASSPDAGVGVHADGGVAGTTGAAGTTVDAGGAAGTTGSAGTAGAAGGAVVRPLGSGCTADAQCGSGICVKDNPAAASGSCCDGRTDACTQCVGGYKVPRSDGTGCGPEMCDGTDRKWNLCKAGVCTAQVVQCATALCDKAGNKICPGGAQPAGCALEDNPCFCNDAAGGSHVSYPCPQVAPPCVPDACGSCVNGVRVPAPDGVSCGASTCSGEAHTTGFPDGSTTYPSSDSHVCRSGVCTIWTTDCSVINCASTCKLKYRGCGTSGVCWCVDSGGSVCP